MIKAEENKLTDRQLLETETPLDQEKKQEVSLFEFLKVDLGLIESFLNAC